MFGHRDRYFAELVVLRGLATAEAVRSLAVSLSDQEPGTFSLALEQRRIIAPGTRALIEAEVDRARRLCSCGEIFYLRERAANVCPRCGRAPTLRDPTSAQSSSASPAPAVSATLPDFDPKPQPRSPQPRVSSSGAALFAAPQPERKKLGPFVLIEELGRGGMGVVYLARHELLNREVALKALLDVKGKRRERFFREARAAARITHRNVVRVHDVGEDEGICYYSMDLVKGRPLDIILVAEGAFDVERALTIVEKLANAVQAVHDGGILHRDLKPGNVIVDDHGEPLLIDFGLARELADDAERLTRTGAAVGTPHYMSPEQVRGIRSEMDQRSDVWALGVILYELLAAERPFKGESTAELYAVIQSQDAPRLRSIAPHVPENVEAVVAKALERAKHLRYASAGELAQELARVLGGMSAEANAPKERAGRARRKLARTARRVGPPLLAAIFILAALAVAFGFYKRAQREALVKQGELDRETVKHRASEAFTRAHDLAKESRGSLDTAAAQKNAAEACATVEDLRKALEAGIATAPGKQEIETQLASPESKQALADALGARGRATLLLHGETVVAEKDLARAREELPHDAELAALHGEALLALSRPWAARKILERALRESGTTPLVRALEKLLAEAQLGCGDTVTAKAALDRVLEAEPNDARARLARARARQRSLDDKGALEDARAAVAAHDTLDVQCEVVSIEIEAGERDAALRRARALFDRPRKESAAIVAFARALEACGDDDQAIHVLETPIAEMTEGKAALLAARAEAHVARLDDERARADLTQAIGALRQVPRRAVELRIFLAEIADARADPDPRAALRELDQALVDAGDEPEAQGAVRLARARRAILIARSADLAQDELGAIRKSGAVVPGTSVVESLVALERKEKETAIEAARRARAEDATDFLAASAEIEAARLSGDTTQVTSASRALAALEDRATDLAARLERRALDAVETAIAVPDPEAARLQWKIAAACGARAAGLGRSRPLALALQACATLKLGEAAVARRLAARALETGGEHPLVLLWGGRVENATDDHVAGARDIAHAVELSPKELALDPQVWRELAVVRARTHEWKGAEEAARKVLELAPESPDMFTTLAEIAKGRGDAEAAAQWKKKHDAVTGNAAVKRVTELVRDANAAFHQERFGDAGALFEEATKIAPQSPDLWRGVAFAKTKSGEQVSAYVAFVRSMELEAYPPGSDPEEHVYIQSAYLKTIGIDIEGFKKSMEELLIDMPRAAHVHLLHAYCVWGRAEFAKPGEKLVRKREEIDEAISDLDKAIALDRRFAIAYAYRGHLKRLRGELGPAREDLDRAVLFARGRMPLAHVFRAGLEAEARETATAVRELQIACPPKGGRDYDGFGDRGRVLRDPALRTLIEENKDAKKAFEYMPPKPNALGFIDDF